LLAIEAIAESESPLSLTTLATRLNAPKSTLHPALVARRYLEVDRDHNYRLSVRALEVGAAYLNRITPLKVADSELHRLSRELGMTAHFAVLDGRDVLYLAKEDAPGVGMRLASAVGTRLPARLTAVGKAILAHLKTNVAADDSTFAEELAQIRRQGYAVYEGAVPSAVRCIGAPVFDGSGRCCGAIGVSYLREDGPSVDGPAKAVVEAAGQASSQLGAGVPVARG